MFSCIEMFFGRGQSLVQILGMQIWLILPEDGGGRSLPPMDGQGQPGGDGEDRGERQRTDENETAKLK